MLFGDFKILFIQHMGHFSNINNNSGLFISIMSVEELLWKIRLY